MEKEILFASVYIDECIAPLLADLLKKEGWDAISAHHIGFLGKDDMTQLLRAIQLDKVFITSDKKDFFNLAKSVSNKGIILVSRHIKLDNCAIFAKNISKLLNRYTKEEFTNLLLWVNL